MTDLALLDGTPATSAELARLAFAGFAHFTAMQVRGGKVRGLDLHLARLRHASLDLFGRAVDDPTTRARIAQAAASRPDASLTVTMFPPTGEFAPADDRAPVTLIRTGPPGDGPAGPLRLDLVAHERWHPEIKHVGEGAKTALLRRAISRGYDDAAFHDANGHITEATIWNLALWDGVAVVWPRAALLSGVTMGILRRRLAARGVPQRDMTISVADLGGFAGAVVMNSWTPAIPLRSIGDSAFGDSAALAATLHDAYGDEPKVAP